MLRPTRCVFGPWSTPKPVSILNSTTSDFGGQVTADDLGYYVQSGRSGWQQLYVSHRPDRQFAWSLPVMITELDTQNEQIEVAPVARELDGSARAARVT
ncbi:MAG TPA: hypothetical protein VFQ65_00115 [Kofleriaceae bacterium]|nr:hypothetical protein [Kofleriaceae bacterium]